MVNRILITKCFFRRNSIKIFLPILFMLVLCSCLTGDFIGMIDTLDVTVHGNEKYTTLLIGYGFNDKAFHIVLIPGEIKYRDDRSVNTDNSLINEYIELEKYDEATEKYIQIRFPEASKLDFEKRELILYYDNGDVEKYTFRNSRISP